MAIETSRGIDSSHPTTVQEAAAHVLKWVAIEDADYAETVKFGHGVNLANLREGGLEHRSVWSDQLANYWSRAVTLQSQLSELNGDTTIARQHFGKFLNASRALFGTVVIEGFGYDPDIGRAHTHEMLSFQVAQMSEETIPFLRSEDFDPGDFWDKSLRPKIDEARVAIRGGIPDDVTWQNAVGMVDEKQRYISAAGKLEKIMYAGFGVTVAYVFSDGPMPEPAHTSGEIQQWEEF